MNQYINPANAVTVSRFLTLGPILYFVDTGNVQWATWFIIICGLFDKLDGAVAKLFNCSSAFGEMLDAVADAVCYTFLLIVIWVYDLIPVPAIAIIVGAGALNVIMRGIYMKRAGRTTNYHSYAMERLVAYVAFLVAIVINQYEVVFFSYAGAGLMLTVVLHDSKRMLWDPIPDPGDPEPA